MWNQYHCQSRLVESLHNARRKRARPDGTDLALSGVIPDDWRLVLFLFCRGSKVFSGGWVIFKMRTELQQAGVSVLKITVLGEQEHLLERTKLQKAGNNNQQKWAEAGAKAGIFIFYMIYYVVQRQGKLHIPYFCNIYHNHLYCIFWNYGLRILHKL